MYVNQIYVVEVEEASPCGVIKDDYIQGHIITLTLTQLQGINTFETC